MKKVLGCQQAYKIVHGDIHIGNVVYHALRGVLRLIDYDEADIDYITRRTPQTKGQKRVHNQELLEDPVAFTKNQLINLFWLCWARRTDLPATLELVREAYDATFQGKNRPNAGTVNQIYDELCDELEKYNKNRKFKADCSTLLPARGRSLTIPVSFCFQSGRRFGWVT